MLTVLNMVYEIRFKNEQICKICVQIRTCFFVYKVTLTFHRYQQNIFSKQTIPFFELIIRLITKMFVLKKRSSVYLDLINASLTLCLAHISNGKFDLVLRQRWRFNYNFDSAMYHKALQVIRLSEL